MYGYVKCNALLKCDNETFASEMLYSKWGGGKQQDYKKQLLYDSTFQAVVKQKLLQLKK